MKTHCISWWNVENLFDIETSGERADWLRSNLKHELKGWDKVVLNQKLHQLARVIRNINQGSGPDILGLCETENKNVVELLMNKIGLSGRRYTFVHKDSDDPRGIDIAFIYDRNKYTLVNEIYTYEVLKRSATRAIFQFELKTKQGHSIILIGNHWPARSAGQYQSEPYRMMAGETLSYWMKRIQEIRGKDIPVVVMGDFNDNPYNRSLCEYALSCRSRNKVIYGKNPYLYNLMWELLGQRKGTYHFDSEPQMLDQFMVSKGLAKKSGVFDIPTNAVRLEIFEGMATGRYKKPLRFGRPSKKSDFNTDGFSDHFPVSLYLNEKEKRAGAGAGT